MDIDQHERTPGQLGIQAIPTLIMFNGGREIGRLVGPHPLRLKAMIDKVLADNGVQVA
jgi:thioredoxin-like negative regulator of GroEL